MYLSCKKETGACLNFDNGYGPEIEIKTISETSFFKGHTLQDKIIFLLDGQLTYSFGVFHNCTMNERQMLFLPPDYRFTFKAPDQARIMIIRLLQKIRFCDNYGLDNLAYRTTIQDVELETKNRQSPFLLEINQAIDAYTRNLIVFMQKGLCCRYYFEIKIKELFYLLRMFYTKDELVQFFRKTLTLDSSFSHFILHNYHRYKTLSEMATAMNMTLSGFEKRFKKVFGISGGKWMNQHKAKKIYHAISSNEATFKELSDLFGFSSQSTFNDFCKKNLGMTPGQIRKKNLNGWK